MTVISAYVGLRCNWSTSRGSVQIPCKTYICSL